MLPGRSRAEEKALPEMRLSKWNQWRDRGGLVHRADPGSLVLVAEGLRQKETQTCPESSLPFLVLAKKISERGEGMLLQRNLSGLGIFNPRLLPSSPHFASENCVRSGLACKSLITRCITRTRPVPESTPLCAPQRGGVRRPSGRSSPRLERVSPDLRLHICRERHQE